MGTRARRREPVGRSDEGVPPLRFRIRERTSAFLEFDAQDIDALGEALGLDAIREAIAALEERVSDLENGR